MQKIYIFDLDGTLIDSMPIGVGIALGFLDEQGISYPDDIVKTLTPLGYKGVAAYYAANFGTKYSAEEIYADFSVKTRRAYAELIPLKPHVKETLEALKARGDRLNVLTASPRELTELCLKRLGVYGLFDFVWSIDDFSLSKADEEIYALAAARIGVEPSACIMADDNVNVLKTAKRAGMQTLGVYDESAKDEEAEMRATANAYVRDFAQILALA